MTTAAQRKVMAGRDAVKVAVVQRSPVFMNLSATIDRVVASIAEAGANGAELTSFSEACLPGYPYWTAGWDSTIPQWAPAQATFHDNALVIPSPELDRICAAAKKSNMNVVLGVNELDARSGVQTVYNTVVFIDRFGTFRGRHRKLVPTFIEKIFWGVGNGNDIFAVDFDNIGRVTALICGETESPVIMAAQLAGGCDFLITEFPGSFALSQGPRLQEPNRDGRFWGSAISHALALAAGAFVLKGVAILNPKDVDPSFPFAGKQNIDYAIGGSEIIAPLPDLTLAGPVYDQETILYAVCPSAMIKAVKGIADTNGSYARPDAVRVQVRDPVTGVWRTVPEESVEVFPATTAASTTP